MADSGNVIARAYVAIIPTMEGSQSTITKELTGVTEPASKEAGESSGKTFGESLANGLKTTGAVIGAAMTAVTGVAVATGKAFVDSAKDVASFGDEIQKNAQKMGNMSYSTYQEWDFILQHCGTSIEGMKSSMLKLTKAAESGNEAFETLGISQEELANMSQEEIFNATISALQNVEDEAQRTVLANELLGKSAAVELAPLLNMTASETEDLRQQVHDLGGVMSDEAVEASATFQDEMQNMETSLDGLKRNMMSEFLPGLSKTMKGLSKIFSGDESGIGEIQSGLEEVIANVTALAPQFFTLAETLIMSLISGFAPQIPSLATTIFSVLNQALLTLVGMLPQLMPAITSGIQSIMQSLFTCLPIITQSIFTLIKDLMVWMSEDNNIQEFINGIIQLTVLITNQFAEILPILLPAIVKIIGEIVNCLLAPENVEMLLGAVLNLAGAIFVALVNCVPELIDFVLGLFDNLTGLVAKFLEWIVPIVSKGLSNLISIVSGWGSNIRNFVTNLWTNIKNGVSNFITNLKNGFSNGFNTIKNNISNIVNNIKNFVTNCINTLKQLPQQAFSMGYNLIAGLWNGISNMVEWVLDKVRGFANNLIGVVKKAFGIASPSKQFAIIGGYLAEGLGEGWSDEIGDVKSDMVDSMNGLTGSMTAEVSAYASGNGMVGSSSVINGGSININVYGAEGQNVNDLAEIIAIKLESMTERKGKVYA